MYHIEGRITRPTDPLADWLSTDRIQKLVRSDSELAATLLRWSALGRVVDRVVAA
jgi:hypothetical protein